MPCQLRIQYPGATYHVMSRGNRRQDIFLQDVDRQDFLKTLAEAYQQAHRQVHAYCLTPSCRRGREAERVGGKRSLYGSRTGNWK